LHTPFTFDTTGSEKADAFLKARAEHLLTLTPDGRAVFLKSAIQLARLLPLNSVENCMVKAMVVMTLEGWLDQVTEEVTA